MKGNPKTGVKHKTQKSVKFQIEEDKVLEAYVTHWQELETHDRVQQWQEQEKQDHNFRHGAKNSSHNYIQVPREMLFPWRGKEINFYFPK